MLIKSGMRFLLIGLKMLSCVLVYPQARPGVGEPAHVLAPARYLYGEAWAGYEPGKIYLIEFTHTQCKPCREAIPHLTDLAKAFEGDLEVMSVYSYYESDKKTEESYVKEIRALKALMGSRMEFTVAIDKRDRYNYRKWKGDGGAFPYSFVVDRNGRIAWEGVLDVKEIAGVVGRLLAGKYDAMAERERHLRFDSLYQPLLLPYHQRSRTPISLDTMVERLAPMRDEFPEKRERLDFLKYAILLRKDGELASAYLAALLEKDPDFTFRPDPDFINTRNPGLDWRLGLVLFDREIEKSKDDIPSVAFSLFLKSQLYAFNGAYDDAIETLQRAITVRKAEFGELDRGCGVFYNWMQAYRFHVLREQDRSMALAFLDGLLLKGELSREAAGALSYRLNQGIQEGKIAELKRYLKESRARE